MEESNPETMEGGEVRGLPWYQLVPKAPQREDQLVLLVFIYNLMQPWVMKEKDPEELPLQVQLQAGTRPSPGGRIFCPRWQMGPFER